MKIVAVNGSHKGKSGNTDIMVDAFLQGAREGGAETSKITLAEKEIKHCKACKSCWFNESGKCVIKDDMAGLLSALEGADVWVWATPLYFDNISSMFKTFIDRLMVLGSPYWTKDDQGECRHLTAKAMPKLVIISNCGYPERSHFQVISHWIKRHARNLGTELIGEIYASEGALLNSNVEAVQPVVSNYLRALETAGREVATDLALSEETKRSLEQPFLPDEIYIQRTQQHIERILKGGGGR